MGAPSRFIFSYKVGTRKKCWECLEVNSAMARARFWKQPFTRGPGVRLLGVYIARESIVFDSGEAGKPLGFITPSQSLTELPNGTEGL